MIDRQQMADELDALTGSILPDVELTRLTDHVMGRISPKPDLRSGVAIVLASFALILICVYLIWRAVTGS